MDRDPRIEPQAGDRLWAKQTYGCDQSDIPIIRTVRLVRDGIVYHNRGVCKISTWRRWASKATFVGNGLE